MKMSMPSHQQQFYDRYFSTVNKATTFAQSSPTPPAASSSVTRTPASLEDRASLNSKHPQQLKHQ